MNANITRNNFNDGTCNYQLTFVSTTIKPDEILSLPAVIPYGVGVVVDVVTCHSHLIHGSCLKSFN